MFFSFPKRKIAVIITSTFLIVSGAFVTVSAGERMNVAEISSVYLRQARENIAYWWRSNLAGGGLASVISYSSPNTGTARSVPVLTYHGLSSESDENEPFSPSVFSEHMKVLTEAGWRTITLEQFEDFVSGRENVPEKSFLLTFDDGRKDTFYPADPVLADLGMNAVMFAITKHSVSPDKEKSPYYLSPYELRAMEETGRWDVQSHGRDSHDWYLISQDGSVGHFFSNLLWLEGEGRNESDEEFEKRIEYDLRKSQEDLESALGKEVRAFAYPFGDFGQDGANHPGAVEAVLEKTRGIYDLAFHQIRNINTEIFNYPESEPFLVKRIEPLGSWSGRELLALLESGRAKNLPYSATSFGRDWRSSWGITEAGDVLDLKAAEGSTGAAAGLSGARLWSDYSFSTDAAWHAGTNIVLSARVGDEENYFGCNFGRGKVYIKTLADGASRNLAEADYFAPQFGTTARLSISVDGGNVSCSVDGRVVLSSFGINGRIQSGGIGLEIWDENPGVAHVAFDNVLVEEN